MRIEVTSLDREPSDFKRLHSLTSAPVLSFLEALSKPHVTDLAKVCLRNAIWEAGQEKNERYKPIAMYYLAEILKCLEDKKKILAITDGKL